MAGILDVTDNQHAYLRTSGYLPGPKDVYVSNQLIKDNGLRAGDAVTGWVREGADSSTPHQGGRNNRRQNRAGRVKYNPMVSVETVNGMDAERSKRRPEFAKLTPLLPPGAAAAGDHAQGRHPADHRPGLAHRQGAARAHRLPAQGG